MFIELFLLARTHGVPVSLTELIDLNTAIAADVIEQDIEQFYVLVRSIWVKDERFYDRFDRAFADYLGQAATIDPSKAIPDEWLRRELQRQLSDEDKAKLKSLGGLDELIKQFQERLAEQQKRHAGGSKWIGTGGTSPFGAYGYNPEGIRIGQDGSNARRAVKVWDKREFKDLDNDELITARSMQVALKKLRRFARTGAAEEFDLNGTIEATSKQGGLLELRYQNERHNAIKLLVLFDIGGSMDDHIYTCQQLFSAVRTEFKHLEYYYFHNCVYEHLWRKNKRRFDDTTATLDVLHTYGSDYKLIIVGDATMGPYEIAYPGGSVEHWNDEAGEVWLRRLLQKFPNAVWLNPQIPDRWPYYPSVQMLNQIMDQRMYPLTVDGLSRAIKELL